MRDKYKEIIMWIGISKKLSQPQLRPVFKDLYPGKDVFFGTYDELATNNCPALLIKESDNPSEFPYVLSISAFMEFDEYWDLLKLAEKISVMHKCRTICDGSFHGPTNTPYWSIIWEEGVPFLADDSFTIFADYDTTAPKAQQKELGHVKIIKKIGKIYPEE